MAKENRDMKLLKIQNNQGYFLRGDQDYSTVDKITKDDLMKLVDYALTQDVTFDEYIEAQLKNQAHQIVYKSLYEKLARLSERKNEFEDECERQYLKEYEKYCETSQ